MRRQNVWGSCGSPAKEWTPELKVLSVEKGLVASNLLAVVKWSK